MMNGVARLSTPTATPTTTTATAAAAGVAAAIQEGGGKTIEEELSLPILLAERVRKAVQEAESFKSECAEVGKQVDSLAGMLRSAVRCCTSTSPPPYDRPVRRIVAEASKSLERALALVRRCKRRRSGLLRRVVAITTGGADFRKLLSLLDASLGDLRWLLSVFDNGAGSAGGGIVLSLPPIASTDPILSWVWSYIATVQMGGDRLEAAASLANLALDNDRNKKIIIEEGGVPPLLSLLRDGPSADAQAAAATALSNLASSPENVSLILKDHLSAVSIIVHVLSDSPMPLQTKIASLISRMASYDAVAQEEFARENAIRPLVSLLSFEIPLDEPKPPPKKPTSIHSLVQGMGMAATTHTLSPVNSSRTGSMSKDHHHHRKERENETPEVKLKLKIACAEALWMLSRGCISNSRKITETKGLLCLSKIVEKEKGELQHNCMMTIMEIAAAAESDADLRRSAFKMNSPAAKSVVDQLLRVVQQESSAALQIAAMKAIGSLARTFPARETRVLSPLVQRLSHWNPDVATEAAAALGKFANPENFLCVEHSKAIIEFTAVPQLMRLIRTGEKTQLHGLVLLCYLALHVPKSEALERALGPLESLAQTPLAQHPSLKDLLPKATYHLALYRAGTHTHRQM